MKKILGGVLISFLLLGLGIVVGNKIGSERKDQTSPVTNNYQKEYEKTSEENKTLKGEIAETKKALKAKEDMKKIVPYNDQGCTRKSNSLSLRRQKYGEY